MSNENVPRRDFLRIAAFTVLGVTHAACTPNQRPNVVSGEESISGTGGESSLKPATVTPEATQTSPAPTAESAIIKQETVITETRDSNGVVTELTVVDGTSVSRFTIGDTNQVIVEVDGQRKSVEFNKYIWDYRDFRVIPVQADSFSYISELKAVIAMEKGVPRHLITHDGTPLTEVILGAAVVPPRTSTKDVWVWDAIVGRMKNSTTLIPPELEREWIERGYLPDHRNIRTWTKLDVEVAGEHIPCTGARWGSTQILVPQEWIKKELRFVGGFEDAYKPARKGLVVSQSTPEAQYYMEAWGAIVHAIHTGIVDLNLNLTNHGWYSQYLNEVAGNRLEPYSFNKTDNGIVEIGKVDPHLPVTVVYLPSRATQESVKKIPGGHPMAPYGSDSLGKDRTGWAEYYKWEVTGQGGLVIYCSTAINAEGKHMGVAADILTIATPLIYATVEDIKRTGQLESGPHVGQSIRKNLRFRSEWLPELDYPINYFGFPMARK